MRPWARIRVPDDVEFRQLWGSGATVEKIGERYGVSGPAISKAARRYGYDPRMVTRGDGYVRRKRAQKKRPAAKVALAIVASEREVPAGERRLMVARERGTIPFPDFWTLDRDLQLLRCQGRYEAMNNLSLELGISYSRLLSRWHVLRTL
ncbi:hypothetical protein [Pontibaca salina]|uniref:Uncharacterized protein n=1 Tax=Pontibaca salina TaxID=2795731 RepID=A0A934HMZ6_9RHOB|nr:hypothetical protein [Pontibaca salina]MBI6628342.1 hypothetical protein [Pontibaca salina]